VLAKSLQAIAESHAKILVDKTAEHSAVSGPVSAAWVFL
jgi:hypothetical protein